MKLPRDISGIGLSKRLKTFGYELTRQSGSHLRLTSYKKGEHHITIPNHDPLKIGTLSAILSEISAHFSITKEEIIKELF